MVIAIICDHLQRIVNLADNNKLHIHSRAVTIKTTAQYQSIGAAVQDDVRTLIKADTEREGDHAQLMANIFRNKEVD